MNGPANGPITGTFISKPCASDEALETVENAHISMAKYKVGRHVYGCGHGYDSVCLGARCRFFAAVEPENPNAVNYCDNVNSRCLPCRKKTLARRATRARQVERELKALMTLRILYGEKIRREKVLIPFLACRDDLAAQNLIQQPT
ncbi:hypothetical protein HBI81_064320 [Parastagonospora nodorum]|nr:hypothetical protein HBH47_044760 [Parastagonospora nodorum]KAH5205263.1 hypothetical protein HBH77_096660 [Parastagonospora nodorum]KAH5213859.1 hypothetical protein HBH68_066090 [Parastagonospora nodorum]KAH5720763.1 hypothetical protein HBI18_154630 [Parastagonospora nodorum]KAH6112830.1 hypothetical protein HBI64_212830 [Parastagonospora nodorum]